MSSPVGVGSKVEAQREQGDALHFVAEAFKHGKAIGATGEGVDLLRDAGLPGIALSDGDLTADKGVVTLRHGTGDAAERFVEAVAQHRHFDREHTARVPA